ncbi:MAG: TVP38/TMEM64 family protein [Candidatus Binataceae bacterium]
MWLALHYVASDWVFRRAGERLARLMRGVEEEGWRFVAFVRLVPLFPFNLVNYAFGLTRIRLGEYVLASFMCIINRTWFVEAGQGCHRQRNASRLNTRYSQPRRYVRIAAGAIPLKTSRGRS